MALGELAMGLAMANSRPPALSRQSRTYRSKVVDHIRTTCQPGCQAGLGMMRFGLKVIYNRKE